MTTKTTKKNYSSKTPDEVKFYTGKGKHFGKGIERWIQIDHVDGSTQRIVMNAQDWERIVNHLSGDSI